jgi:DNA-3-methyladenine glycosylase II
VADRVSASPLFSDLPRALAHWKVTDPKLFAIASTTPLGWRGLPDADPFSSLVQSIVHQQVSLAAGQTIYARLIAAVGGRIDPSSILHAGLPRLRGAGLSTQKASYVTDLAERVSTGSLDLGRLQAMPDHEVVEALTQVKGIGVWSAKMHLLFHLQRPDVVAHEDIGLQIAVARLYRVPRAKAAAKMLRQAPRWSPYASLAALTLWQWRRAVDAKPASGGTKHGGAHRGKTRGDAPRDARRANPKAGARTGRVASG